MPGATFRQVYDRALDGAGRYSRSCFQSHYSLWHNLLVPATSVANELACSTFELGSICIEVCSIGCRKPLYLLYRLYLLCSSRNIAHLFCRDHISTLSYPWPCQTLRELLWHKFSHWLLKDRSESRLPKTSCQ